MEFFQVTLGIIIGYLLAKLIFKLRYDVIEEPTFGRQEDEILTRTAYIEKIDEGKFFVYDKLTNAYLCKFTSWKKLSEQLTECDNKVNWMVEHCYPEIDRNPQMTAEKLHKRQ